MKKLHIKFYQCDDGQWQFQLCSRNGEALMTSERYKSKQSMRRAIEIVVNRPIDRLLKEGKPNIEDH